MSMYCWHILIIASSQFKLAGKQLIPDLESLEIFLRKYQLFRHWKGIMPGVRQAATKRTPAGRRINIGADETIAVIAKCNSVISEGIFLKIIF
jgi:hypothetical protein